MKFIYQARNQKGELKKGTVVATNQAKAEQLLNTNNYAIISLSEQKETLTQKIENFIEDLTSRISYKDVVLFSRQFSTLVGARVPIVQSLRILGSQVSNKGLIRITKNLVQSVESGESLSLALSKHPKVFGNIYVSLVRSGEASGRVAESLSYLADQLEKDYDLRSRVKTAMTYPAFVLSALVLVGILMFKFVLPNLVGVLKEQNAALPLVSRILIQFTDFFNTFWWMVILVIVGAVIGLRFYIQTVSGRYFWDEFKMKVPIIGTILNRIYLARFARNLSTLVSGGIPIIKSLQIISEIINNVIYRDIMMEAAQQVTNGKTISESLARHKEFPPLVTQMVAVGEQTAQLDTILLKLAMFYEKEVDAQVSTLSSLLEPIIMLVLGLGVGLLVAGVLLPIYNLASAT
ncbi:MAG TPA: type II secretion system F family protein [Patescibacteria group bacterium]|jgi:type IV pilus assembly protein PilC|nr:type II secretion system F family protein [Patescibacteria group bacterium]